VGVGVFVADGATGVVGNTPSRMVVGSQAMLLLGLVSAAAAMLAQLVTVGNASLPTNTVSVMMSPVPGMIVPNLVHVATCPALLQVQSVPTADTKVSPGGSVSVTVRRPVVGPAPMFATMSRYRFVVPVVNVVP